jgi:Methane oxygenase PmoA
MSRPVQSALDGSIATSDQEKEPESMPRHLQRSHTVLIFIVLALAPTGPPARADSWRMTVRGGETNLVEPPVVVELKEPVPVGLYVVHAPSGEGAFAAQIFEDKGVRRLGAVLPRVDARQAVTYTLKGPAEDYDALKISAQSRSASPSGLSFDTSGGNLKVKLGEQLLTEYHLGVGNKPFFFPLNGPTGESYTRTFPLEILPDEDHDHPHQRSCWFTYGNVNGVDFWSEGKRFGTIQEIGRKLVVSGPVVGRLTTMNEWRAADGRKFCLDERTVTFYHTKTARIIDFAFRIAANDEPVTFQDTKEGMFGVRVASSMDVTKKKGGKITNAEGLTDEEAWGKPSPWVDYAGPVKDRIVGIAMINHPQSFRYPTTWHVRTYGLFAANPFGWHDFGRSERGDYTIPSGQAIEFFYRVVLHEGDTRSANIPSLAAAYTKPPELEIVKD